MATSINDMVATLRRQVGWQKTPVPVSDAEYIEMVRYGIKKLYIDTGRASIFHNSMIQRDEWGDVVFTQDLQADEEEYAMICAQISFFQRVATDVNNIVGYTTDALTVTHADKPYENLKDTMDRLERERRILYYKMVRYTIAS